mmetsp:Transcript_24522/g.52218  ORF Transcript_24522/g.52218 Transcript_24522/m.52218 type:complete len:240 (-) Transcript_24522:1183-1902(-)
MSSLYIGGNDVQDRPSRVHDPRPGSEDGRARLCFRQEVLVVLRRDDPTRHHHHVARTEVPEFLLQGRQERLVASRLAGHPDDVNVRIDGLEGDLPGGLEERPDVDVESKVGKAAGDDLRSTVVAVLSHLRHEDPGSSPLGNLECFYQPERRLVLVVAAFALLVGGALVERRGVHPLYHGCAGNVPAPSIFQCKGHFPQGAPSLGARDAKVQQVVRIVSAAGAFVGEPRACFEFREGVHR